AEALAVLERARRIDFGNPAGLRALAVVYSRTGRDGEAALVTAERLALGGRLDLALPHARRATGLLTRGTPEWIRADELQRAAERAAQER
ncbi:MAG: peptidase M48, partial [Pseudomonadota bacterium]